MSRPTIAVGLPEPERTAVLEALQAAGFGTVALESGLDLTAVLEAELPVGLAIIDAGSDPATLLDAVTSLRLGERAIPVMVVSDPDHLETLHGDGGLGPDDEVVLRPIEPDALRWRAEAMLIRSQIEAEHTENAVLSRGRVEADWAARSPIIAVFNPKGGVGKTTIATNLAAALQRKDRRVLLVDADTVTGHVTMSLGMDAGRTIADAWLDEAEGGPPETLLDIAAVHESGIRVAALVSSPLAMVNLDPERVGEALLAARWGVDVIVVDLHPSYSEVNQVIFGVADRVLVPVTPDLPAIRAAVQLNEVATELGFRDRLGLVINRAESGVSIEDIERAVGLPSFARIRSGGMLFVKAANVGRTVIDLFPKEKVSGDFEVLADRVLGFADPTSVAQAPEKTSRLGGIFGPRKEPVRV
ncbi:MAG: AAA family ATPase [Candidatus Limnocylindrales bacterium]